MTDYKEFAAKIKEKYPQYKDVDDLTLAQKVIEKYPQYKEKVTFEEVKETKPKAEKRNIDLTPSGIINNSVDNLIAGIETPVRMAKNGQNLKEAFDSAKQAQRDFRADFQSKHPVASKAQNVQDLMTDLIGYSYLPTIKGAGAANVLKNALVQGGITGAIEGLKHGGTAGSALGGAAMGTGIAGLLGSIPYVGKLAGKSASNLAPRIASKISQTELDTINQAIKPTSKALDLNKNEAQNLLMNTTERIRNDYKNLLNEKGNTVGELLKQLPEYNTFKAKDILNNYDSIFNSYSLSKNQELNPARNATAKEYEKIKELLLGDGKQRFDEFRQSIDDLKFPKSYLETLKSRYKNQFHNTVLDTFNNAVVKAERAFNDNVLKKIRQNPEIVNDPAAWNELENEVGKIARFNDEELNSLFWDKYYQALDKGNILQEGENFINPKELYDINKNINNMIDWDKPSAALKNDVLEQMYLSNANRISKLSPELKAANKAYADLMDFQKNEGIRRILNNQNNIDTASSALRNYNSTVTKGNTNRNIQDLEKLLTDAGNKPFLNDIDDVNAAMDLLKKEGTGLGGLAGLAKEIAIIPALKGVRAINRSGIPYKLQKAKDKITPTIQKILPSLGAKAGANMLYGGVQYNDYQE